MERTFILHLSVDQVNIPPGVGQYEEFNVNVTLQHNIGHIKELIWIYSEHSLLKPIFLKITYKNATLNDLDTLGAIMGINDPPEVIENDWRLTIDYTLMDSPFIATQAPVLPEFDVMVKAQVGKEMVHYSERYNLNTPVSTVDSDFRSKYNVQGYTATVVIDSSGNETALTGETFRESLHLDVPPLHPVNLHILQMAVIRLTQREGDEEYIDFIGNMHDTCHSVKQLIAQRSGKNPLSIMLSDKDHVVSAELSIPDDRVIASVLGEEFFRRDNPSLTYVCDRPRTSLIETGTSVSMETEVGTSVERNVSLEKSSSPEIMASLEFYTIELNGTTMNFSTSDMIVNERDGYVLVNPVAYARMANRFHVVAGDFGISPERRNTGSSSHGPITAPPIASNHDMQPVQTEIVPNNGGGDITTAHISRSNTPMATPTTNETHPTVDPTPLGENLRQHEPLPGSDNAALEPANIVQERVNLQQIPPIAPQVLPAQPLDAPNEGGRAPTVITILYELAMANRRNFLQFGLEVFAVYLFMGSDFFVFILQRDILIFILVAAVFLLFFFRGQAASEWLNQNVLQDAPQNQLDFELIRKLSQLMVLCNVLTDRFYAYIIHGVTRALQVLVCPRYQWVATNARGESNLLQKAGEFTKEIIGACILFIATLLPSIQEGVDSYLLEVRNSEAQTIRLAILTILQEPKGLEHRQLLERTVQSRFGEDPNEFLTNEAIEEYDDMLRLLKLWKIVNQVQNVFYTEVDRLKRGCSTTIFSRIDDGNTTGNNSSEVSDELETAVETTIENVVPTEGSSGIEVNHANTVITQR